ncbi:hypothetical protein [Flavihumibacter profundi]|jgi:hypothetical protein|uniref:hypothetical protein n=1 Tax=Flavihumibacter profundi TaxID=2716883 RepID=UPI001CC57BDF|nr:hypothetical protein [Flavihumibacter profundi]MBZ5857064.1 hypothetical protein [Flavihumibacter profundi]
MIKPLLTVVLSLLGLLSNAQDAELPAQRNPLLNSVISPYSNPRINPGKNMRINPKQNWNINPSMNDGINPDKNKLINPKFNKDFSPQSNHSINPMYTFSLHPLSNDTWKGYYVFDKDSKMAGYMVIANQFVVLDFDEKGTWKGYLVKTSSNTYNYFNLQDEWTRTFFCEDSMVGFNQFDGTGEWTGIYAK